MIDDVSRLVPLRLEWNERVINRRRWRVVARPVRFYSDKAQLFFQLRFRFLIRSRRTFTRIYSLLNSFI